MANEAVLSLTEAERQALAALEKLLDLTDESDWVLVNMTVRSDVLQGKYSAAFEDAYKALVDKKFEARMKEGGCRDDRQGLSLLEGLRQEHLEAGASSQQRRVQALRTA